MVGQNSRTNLLQVSYCAVYRQVKLFLPTKVHEPETFAGGIRPFLPVAGKNLPEVQPATRPVVAACSLLLPIAKHLHTVAYDAGAACRQMPVAGSASQLLLTKPHPAKSAGIEQQPAKQGGFGR
jgi:hypothetical protein